MYVGHGGIAVSLTIGSSLSLPDVDNTSFTEVLPLWLTSWRERASGLSASESSMNLKELTRGRVVHIHSVILHSVVVVVVVVLARAAAWTSTCCQPVVNSWNSR